MIAPSLAVYAFGYQLDKIKYPWREAIHSAIALAVPPGCVYFCSCDDETSNALEESFSPQLSGGVIVELRHEWGTNYRVQAEIANYILDEIGTEYDYALKLDMDEILCEWTFNYFRDYNLPRMYQGNALLALPNYTHFCPDDKHTFKFIYGSKAVISKTSSGFRFSTGHGGDACALGGAVEYSTSLGIHHYGKMEMGREREALVKEHEFQKLYVELGFPDPKVEALWNGQGYMDYYKVFDLAKERGEFESYDGPHPIFVREWLERMRERSVAFWKEQENAR